MSAYLCHDDTFDYIGAVLRTMKRETFYIDTDIAYAEIDLLRAAGILSATADLLNWSRDAETVVKILRFQNVRSIEARYPGDSDMLDGGDAYRMRFDNIRDVAPIVALKTLHALEYQSCETDDYERTLAHAMTVAIEKALVCKLGGYADAPWGYTRAWDADRRVQLKAKIAAAMGLRVVKN